MNLLARSLSPSGQQASSPTASSSRSKQNRRANESKSRHARQTNLSAYGYTQPHMLFQLDADPVPEPVSSPTSPRSYPWSRFQKQKSSSRPYYDSFSSVPSPDGNFDYFEYFSNYGKLSSSPSTSPVVSPDEPWSRERFQLYEPGTSSRYLGPEPGSRSQPSSFRPGSISFRKLFRRSGPPSPPHAFPVIGDQSPDTLRPPFPGPSHYSHYNHSASSPPSPLPAASSGPNHAAAPSAAPLIKRYFSSPADSSGHLVMPSADPYAIIRPVPSLDNHHTHYASYPLPPNSYVRCPTDSPSLHRVPADRSRCPLPPGRYRSRESSLGPPDRYLRPESIQQAVLAHQLEREPPEERSEQNDFRSSGRPPRSLYRISFIETNVYMPQDVPASSSSPEHMPPHHRFHKHLHGEW